MNLWHIFSAPKIASLLLISILIIILPTLINFINYNSIIIIEWELLNINNTLLTFPIILDKYRLTFSFIVRLISLSVIIFTTIYISNDPNLEYFIYIVIFFVISINFLIFIPNLIFLLLGWDGLGLTSYLLVIYYQRDSSLSAGIITAITNRIGDSLLIVARAWLLTRGHWIPNLINSNILILTTICITIAAITKRAQTPFSAWLPAAIAAPTPVSSLVHSSTLVTAGIYLLFRFYDTISQFSIILPFLFYSGVLTCTAAGVSALLEYDFKKIVALSTLRQLGIIIIALGIGQPMLAFFHLITHALFKALLFICAGNIIHCKQNNQDLRLIGNLWISMPVTCTFLNVANLALCGFPFIAGFYSKDAAIELFLSRTFPLSTRIILLTSICLTAAYSIRLSILTLWSPFKGIPTNLTRDERIHIYLAGTILFTGAVSGGAIIHWILTPTILTPSLPPALKLIALTLITLFTITGFLITKTNIVLPGKHLFSNLWFLNRISSTPLLQWSFKKRSDLNKNEITWIEILRGKGSIKLITSLIKPIQQSQGLTFSQLYATFACTIIILLFII